MTDPKYPLVTALSTFDAVILCDGDYPLHPIPLSILNQAPYLVCCDGAGMNHILHGGTPDAIVGDGDSLPEDFKRRYVLETLDWYLDFSPEIAPALRDLTKTMEHKIAELPLDYAKVDDWVAVDK